MKATITPETASNLNWNYLNILEYRIAKNKQKDRALHRIQHLPLAWELPVWFPSARHPKPHRTRKMCVIWVNSIIFKQPRFPWNTLGGFPTKGPNYWKMSRDISTMHPDSGKWAPSSICDSKWQHCVFTAHWMKTASHSGFQVVRNCSAFAFPRRRTAPSMNSMSLKTGRVHHLFTL